MAMTEEEVLALRRYLHQGGFLVVDDFWGTAEWVNFAHEMGRVLPGRPIEDIPLDHPVFRAFFEVNEIVQVPNVGQGIRGGPTWERDGYHPVVRGIFDDEGRLMVLVNWNTDLGDAWEWAENPYYPPALLQLRLRDGDQLHHLRDGALIPAPRLPVFLSAFEWLLGSPPVAFERGQIELLVPWGVFWIAAAAAGALVFALLGYRRLGRRLRRRGPPPARRGAVRRHRARPCSACSVRNWCCHWSCRRKTSSGFSSTTPGACRSPMGRMAGRGAKRCSRPSPMRRRPAAGRPRWATSSGRSS